MGGRAFAFVCSCLFGVFVGRHFGHLQTSGESQKYKYVYRDPLEALTLIGGWVLAELASSGDATRQIYVCLAGGRAAGWSVAVSVVGCAGCG